jgi:hypothetical protein
MLKEQKKRFFIKLSVNETKTIESPFFIGLACYKNAELKRLQVVDKFQNRLLHFNCINFKFYA